MLWAYPTSYNYTIMAATMPLPCLTHNGIQSVPKLTGPPWFDPCYLLNMSILNKLLGNFVHLILRLLRYNNKWKNHFFKMKGDIGMA